MKLTKIKYERLQQSPTKKFENRRISVEATLEENEDPVEAYAKLRRLVDHQMLGEGPTPAEVEKAQRVLADAEGRAVNLEIRAPKPRLRCTFPPGGEW